MAKQQPSTGKKKNNNRQYRRLTDNIPIEGLETEEQKIQAYTELLLFYTNKEEENLQQSNKQSNKSRNKSYYKGVKADIVRLKKLALNRKSKKKCKMMNNVTSPRPTIPSGGTPIPSGGTPIRTLTTLQLPSSCPPGIMRGHGHHYSTPQQGSVSPGRITRGRHNGQMQLLSPGDAHPHRLAPVPEDPYGVAGRINTNRMTPSEREEYRKGLLEKKKSNTTFMTQLDRVLDQQDRVWISDDHIHGLYLQSFVNEDPTAFSPQQIEPMPQQSNQKTRRLLADFDGAMRKRPTQNNENMSPNVPSNKKRCFRESSEQTGDPGKSPNSSGWDNRMITESPEQKEAPGTSFGATSFGASSAPGTSFGVSSAPGTFFGASAPTPGVPAAAGAPFQFNANMHIGSNKKPRSRRGRN